MRMRPLAIWLAVTILVLAFWPAITEVLSRLSLPLPPLRGTLTWVDIMVFIALAILAIRALLVRRANAPAQREVR